MLGAIRRRFLPDAVIMRAEDVARPDAGDRWQGDGVCLRELRLQSAGDGSDQELEEQLQ